MFMYRYKPLERTPMSEIAKPHVWKLYDEANISSIKLIERPTIEKTICQF